jgi:hypothetical protein
MFRWWRAENRKWVGYSEGYLCGATSLELDADKEVLEQ